MSSKPSNNTNLASYKISSLTQIAKKLETDVNVQRVERMVIPCKKQLELYVSTSILGLACAHGASDVVSEFIKLKDINLNCGTKASGDQIPEMPPIMMAYNALRNTQEEAKECATDVKKDVEDLSKPYIDIIEALLEKDGLDLSKEFSNHGAWNISIAELLYSDPILSKRESIRKNIINNICKSKGPSHIKDHLLMLACAAGDTTSVQTLLDNNASPLTKNEHGCHSLAITAMNFRENPKEYSKVIEQLTSKIGIEEYKINEQDTAGLSTAHYVAAHCDDQTVKKILKGINDFKGDSRLLIAAYSGGNANVIEYISGLTQISDEVLKVIKDDHGNTVLHHIANSDNPETAYLLKSLIEKGLDINARNKYGVTPLMNAVMSTTLSKKMSKASETNQMNKIDMLLSRKELDLNACERNGNTTLMIACQGGDHGSYQTYIE